KDAELIVFRRRNSATFEISDGSATLDEVPASDDVAGELARKLSLWARWLRVVQLQNPQTDLRASMELIPTNQARLDDEAVPVLLEGDSYRVLVRNESQVPLHVSVVLAATSGEMQLLEPT